MKNLFSILFLASFFFITSCSTTPGISDQSFDNCTDSDGYLSAKISGSDNINQICATANVTELAGVNLIIGLSVDGVITSGTEIVYDNYFIITGALLSSKNNGCVSDNTDVASASFTYINNLRISPNDDLEDFDDYYSSTEESMDICFDILSETRAKGTFTGTIQNSDGDEKSVTEGEFDFTF